MVIHPQSHPYTHTQTCRPRRNRRNEAGAGRRRKEASFSAPGNKQSKHSYAPKFHILMSVLLSHVTSSVAVTRSSGGDEDDGWVSCTLYFLLICLSVVVSVPWTLVLGSGEVVVVVEIASISSLICLSRSPTSPWAAGTIPAEPSSSFSAEPVSSSMAEGDRSPHILSCQRSRAPFVAAAALVGVYSAKNRRPRWCSNTTTTSRITLRPLRPEPARQCTRKRGGKGQVSSAVCGTHNDCLIQWITVL